ncbi:hypothetical protein F4604DRAFT_1686358 [Suillus subluteus]|nr:hypothetical protein F4604DRAFT_1686358 [Suillus subluteus]
MQQHSAQAPLHFPDSFSTLWPKSWFCTELLCQVRTICFRCCAFDHRLGRPFTIHSSFQPSPSSTHSTILATPAQDKLYDSLEDGNFVPDSMVPGLRSAAPPRSRQNGAMLSDIDNSMQFGGQRGPPQMYQGLHQASMNRKGGIPLQSSQFSGDPSPNPMWPSAQPLPPGLAHLCGRPHGPAQFVNSAMAIPAGLHRTVHSNVALQRQFNNFPPRGVVFTIPVELLGYGMFLLMQWSYSVYYCLAEAMDIFLWSRPSAISVQEIAITPDIKYCTAVFHTGPMTAIYASIPVICHDILMVIIAVIALVKHLRERKELRMKPNSYVVMIVQYHVIYFVLNSASQMIMAMLWADLSKDLLQSRHAQTVAINLVPLFNDTAPFIVAPCLIISIWDTHANDNCVNVSATLEDCVGWTSPARLEQHKMDPSV